MYLVAIEAKPTRASSQYGTVAIADVQVFVNVDDAGDAMRVACELVINHGWEIVATPQCAPCTLPALLATDPELGPYYGQAVREGVGWRFVAWPLVARSDDEVVTQPFPDPDLSSSTKH